MKETKTTISRLFFRVASPENKLTTLVSEGMKMDAFESRKLNEEKIKQGITKSKVIAKPWNNSQMHLVQSYVEQSQ